MVEGAGLNRKTHQISIYTLPILLSGTIKTRHNVYKLVHHSVFVRKLQPDLGEGRKEWFRVWRTCKGSEN